MDLSTLEVQQTATLEVRHPSTGNVIEGMTVTVMGTDSKVYRDSVKARMRKRMNTRKKNGFDPDQAERDGLEMLAELTVDWEGIELEGEALKCNKENCILIYDRFRWLKDQVDEFVADRANFLPSA